MKQKRTCSNCIRGRSIAVNSDILCREKGAVSADYVCSRHRYIPDSKSFKELKCKCINCDFFEIDPAVGHEPSTIGVCSLFSVRKFDGNSKNACSKFSKRRALEVS